MRWVKNLKNTWDDKFYPKPNGENLVMNASDREIHLAVRPRQRRDDNDDTIEIKYLTMTGVTSRRETGSNQTEEEDVLSTDGYYNIVRLN
jgi:hypothetical protein